MGHPGYALGIALGLMAASGSAGAQAMQPRSAQPAAAGPVVLAFGPNSAMLSTSMRQRLDAVGARMSAEPRLRVQVAASADVQEANAHELAARRADVALRWLASFGIDRSRIALQPVQVLPGGARQAVLQWVQGR